VTHTAGGGGAVEVQGLALNIHWGHSEVTIPYRLWCTHAYGSAAEGYVGKCKAVTFTNAYLRVLAV
jgi:hypothetical protein